MPITQSAVNEGLRQRAERAWREKRELKEAGLEDRIAEEERMLRRKLIELGAADFDSPARNRSVVLKNRALR